MQRPVVVLPQPDSPTRPSVSPRRRVKLTPSTARISPACRPRSPLRTGKCLTRSRTSRMTSVLGRSLGSLGRARRSPAPSAGRARPLPSRRSRAGRSPIGSSGGRSRAQRSTAERAAGQERAARRQAREVGRLALDGVEPGAARLVQARDRAQQARACRDGAGWRRAPGPVPRSTMRPGVHDVDAVGVARRRRRGCA